MLSGFLQLGASAINYMSGAHANETNIGLAQRQNQYNVEQWMRENQYNLPQNQVERLKAAGINPALAYANGSMMNESAPSPQMTAGRVQAPYLSPVDLSQIRLNEALAGKADAEGRKADEETQTVKQTREAIVNKLNTETANLLQQNNEIVARINRMAKENEFTDAQIKQFKFDNAMRGKYYRLDKAKLKNDTDLTQAEINQLNASAEKARADSKVSRREYDEMVWTFAIRQAGLEEQVNLTREQVAVAKQTAAKLGLEMDVLSPDAYGRRTLAEDMRGEHGFLNLVGSHAVYAIQSTLHSFGSILK
jgi:hypothetical protein